MSFEKERTAAASWCDAADRIALDHFGDLVPAEVKADGTLVTAADRAIESMLRTQIARTFPADAVLGEETGVSGTGPRRWIIDPIDATTNYVRGIQIFATLIALEDSDGLAVGYVSAPALNERWWAVRGGGAFRNGEAIRVSQVSSLDQAHVTTGGLELFGERLDRVAALAQASQRFRAFGDFYGHMLVAQGSVEAMIDPVAATWDLAAVQIILQEAGGRLTTLDGSNGYDGGNAISSNGLLHDAIVAAVRPV